MILFTLAAGLLLGCAHAAGPVGAPGFLQVSASSGPVSLTLRVLQKKKRVDDILLFQVEIKNIGRDEIFITDPAFREPSALEENSLRGTTATYLEVKNPRGRRPHNAPPEHMHGPVEAVSAQAPEASEPDGLTLGPGQSAFIACAPKQKVSEREWCPLDFWLIYDIGKYKIRAVFDARPSNLLPPSSFSAAPEEVRVATPWLTFEVRP